MDNIINLTAIVGENGSGKTQLLKNIGKMEDKNLIVYFENNQFYFKGNFQLVLKRKKIQKIDLEQKIYYYSPNYIGEKILYSNLFNDISINSIAGERYISKESKIHVDFLLNEQGSNFLKNIGIKSSNKIEIKFQNYTEVFDFNNSKFSDIFKKIKNNIENDNKEALLNLLYLTLYDLDSLLLENLVSLKNELNIKLIILNALDLDKVESIKSILLIFEGIKEKIGKLSSHEKKIERIIKKLRNIIIRFKSLFHFLVRHRAIKNINNKEFLIRINANTIKQRRILHVLEYLENLNNILPNIVKITWNRFSYGERALVNLYASIQYALKKNEGKHIILMIDEGDVGFHPEWQRRFIRYLIDFIKLFDSYEFQIIISTHSPLVITDIPKENILFLGKNEERQIEYQTFAQNIHTILYDGFLDDTIGEFAKVKIAKLVDEMEADERAMSLDEIWKSIQLVGEPLIRKQLEELYAEKVENKNVLERRIAELENELEELKKMRDGNDDSDR